MEKIDISPARIMAHIDIIQTCHFPIADNKENRKKFEEYICDIHVLVEEDARQPLRRWHK